MFAKVIKNDVQYAEYSAAVDRLIALDPEPDSEEGAQLEVLSVLLDDYERRRATIELPDPIDAILFRMEEQGLRQKDLVPYIGSKSKVSEVLAGKRPLSLSMVRALSSGLGIPAKVLVAASASRTEDTTEGTQAIDFSLFPMREMARRGWLPNADRPDRDSLISAVRQFFEAPSTVGLGPAYFRRRYHLGGEIAPDMYAVHAWLTRVLLRSREQVAPLSKYRRPDDVPSFLRSVARLSWSEQGPRLAEEFLSKHGILLVVEAHLPKTHLDGAAILNSDGVPVVGLTLRYDRLDSFWYTLLHELAHVTLHLSSPDDVFVDNTDDLDELEAKEIEADLCAREALIPRAIWRSSDAFRRPSERTVREFAANLGIHPAIVAGRVRRDKANYRLLPKLVGQGQVRRAFGVGG